MTSDFLLLTSYYYRKSETATTMQVISLLKNIILLSINIAFCTSTIKNVQKIWYKKLL